MHAERERLRDRLDIGAQAEIDGELHRIAAAGRTHMHDAARQQFENRASAFDILGLAADQREQFSVAHLRDGAEHRRLDQPRALGFDQRRQFARRHRLQRRHVDKKFARHIAAQKTIRSVENAAHIVIGGDDRNDDIGVGGNRARARHKRHAGGRQRRHRRAIAIPGDDVASVLPQPLAHCSAHSPQSDNPDLHTMLLFHSIHGRPACAARRKLMIR